MKQYTIQEFRKQYPNDAVCLDKIFQLRYGNMEACLNCGVVHAEFKRVTNRRAYYCRECYYQIYPTAGTVFEKSTTPLTYWFYAMYLMTVTRNGVSAKELERALGVTYKCAWRMAKAIRELMGRKKKGGAMTGTIEADETYIGGVSERKDKKPRYGKTPVFAMVQRLGEVRAQKVDNSQKETLFPIIEENVDKTAKVYTDEYKTYVNLDTLGYYHDTVRHHINQYRHGEVSTNTVEGFFSQLKRSIRGTYIHVSPKHLQHYVDEVVFRYNNRKNGATMFNIMLGDV